MRPAGRTALVSLAMVLAGGCGTAPVRSSAVAGRPSASADYAQATEASCATGEANGKPLRTSCTFVLADGRRFSCPERFAHAVQTASALEHATACRAIAPVRVGAAVRRVTAAIESAQACLRLHHVRAIGNAALPPLAEPNSPDGELIVGYLPGGALMAFYRDIRKAMRLEPAVLRNAHRLGAQVERRGDVTILWLRPPAATIRLTVQACLPKA